jgi:hypothetical protein
MPARLDLDNTAGRCVGTRSNVLDGQRVPGPVLPLLTSGVNPVEDEV